MSDIMIRKRKRMREKEIKALSKNLQEIFGVPVFDEKDPVDMAESSDFNVIFVGQDILGLVYEGKPFPVSEICIRDRDILGLVYEDKPFLTIRGLLKYRPTAKAVTVDMGAVPFVTNGADVMGPGITDADESIAEGDLVWIKDIKNGVPLAIGKSLRSGADLKSKAGGKAIKTIHYVGDKLWKTGE